MPDLRKISDLKNLGAKSAAALQHVGIHHAQALKDIGALQAFILLQEEGNIQPSLNFLYAMIGAINGQPWQAIQQSEKAKLLLALETHRAMLHDV